MSDVFSSKKFKALQKEWDAILAADGFDDIEDRRHEAANVIMPEVMDLRTPAVWKDPFFEIYCDYYETGEFPRELDKWIWKLYLQGRSLRDIVNVNEQMKLFNKFSYFLVHSSISSTKKRLGMRLSVNA